MGTGQADSKSARAYACGFGCSSSRVWQPSFGPSVCQGARRPIQRPVIKGVLYIRDPVQPVLKTVPAHAVELEESPPALALTSGKSESRPSNLRTTMLLDGPWLFTLDLPLSRVTTASDKSAAARRWGRKLAADVQAVMTSYPDADADDVRLTLIALQSPPLKRLNRSLRRGRGFAAFRR